MLNFILSLNAFYGVRQPTPGHNYLDAFSASAHQLNGFVRALRLHVQQPPVWLLNCFLALGFFGARWPSGLQKYL